MFAAETAVERNCLQQICWRRTNVPIADGSLRNDVYARAESLRLAWSSREELRRTAMPNWLGVAFARMWRNADRLETVGNDGFSFAI